MKKAWILVIATLLTLGLMACQSAEETKDEAKVQSITGTLAYRERIALPSNAMVTVTLQDISLADAPAVVLAKHKFETNGAQVPFNFDLAYDSSRILPGHRYSISARIESKGKLLFITDTVYSVINDANNTHKVNIKLIKVGE